MMKKAYFGIIYFLSLKCYFLKSYYRENYCIYAEKEQSYQPAIVLIVFLPALQIEIQGLQSVLHYHVITTNTCTSSGISLTLPPQVLSKSLVTGRYYNSRHRHFQCENMIKGLKTR